MLSAAFGEKIFGALDQKVSEAIRSQPDIDSFKAQADLLCEADS